MLDRCDGFGHGVSLKILSENVSGPIYWSKGNGGILSATARHVGESQPVSAKV